MVARLGSLLVMVISLEVVVAVFLVWRPVRRLLVRLRFSSNVIIIVVSVRRLLVRLRSCVSIEK